MTDPFETTVPPGQSRLALRDYPGCAAVIFFGGIHPAVLTTAGRGGYKPAARVNMVLLNGFDGGKIFEDAMLFNSMVVTSLRQVEPGKAIVVHIEVKNAGGQPTPYIEEADENELELARQWYRANPEQWAELLKGTMENFYAGERSIAQQRAATNSSNRAGAASRTKAGVASSHSSNGGSSSRSARRRPTAPDDPVRRVPSRPRHRPRPRVGLGRSATSTSRSARTRTGHPRRRHASSLHKTRGRTNTRSPARCTTTSGRPSSHGSSLTCRSPSSSTMSRRSSQMRGGRSWTSRNSVPTWTVSSTCRPGSRPAARHMMTTSPA